MTTLSPAPVQPVALHSRPTIATPETLILSETSPALTVLTDFARTSPQSVSAARPVDEAHQKMVSGGVRLLLVVDDQGRCSGVLPAREVIGGRRITLAMQQHGVVRADVTAGMIQTPLDKTPTLTLETLASMTLGDLVQSLKSFGEQHLLVTEPTSSQGVRIRGVISAADIGRVLGYGPGGMPEARSFADICKVVLGQEL
ncbi:MULTISPECIES: CBS domain-containing protein [unclassified Halomonas]|uniref:CBS domain-containing protein n=1 Tax=unclassified Halomonas TaxID=2609666 RepID=UPI002468584D|nr:MULTISPECIES: CBS domain-containing protein [unclassified Halomonas]